jgi:nucleotide-binding universal stress UspA family protein
MYRRILVALDYSQLRSVLLDHAIALAKVTNANLMLLHVLSAYEEGSPGLPVRSYNTYYPIVDGVAWETYQKRWEIYEREGIEALKHLAEEASLNGINTEFTQTAGDPGRVICDLADSWGADLIMVGNRGRTGLSEFLLGSVSNYVMHHAHSSVLVVHGENRHKSTESAVETATGARQ